MCYGNKPLVLKLTIAQLHRVIYKAKCVTGLCQVLSRDGKEFWRRNAQFFVVILYQLEVSAQYVVNPIGTPYMNSSVELLPEVVLVKVGTICTILAKVGIFCTILG